MVLSKPKPKSRKLYLCTCGCNRLVRRWTIRRHRIKKASVESPPPLKQRCIAHFQADTDSSSSDHPQLHAASFDFSFSLPSLDPPATLDLLQSPGDGRTLPSGRFVDNVLLSLHTRTHRTTDESDNEDSEDALEGDAAEAADTIDPGTDDFWDGEDVDIEGEVDPRKDVVSDWDILAQDFIVEAERLRKFEGFLMHTLVTHRRFCVQASFLSRTMT